MDPREAPPTDEGWFALHDFRRVDWDAWREAPDRERRRAVEEGVEFLEAAEAVRDADEGGSRTYAVIGHKADLLVVHLRPSLEGVNALERAFERTALAGVTERADSYVSVTEVSGYTVPEAFEAGGIEDVEDAGLRNYLGTRLHPSMPDEGYVCFYPMSKRRGPDHNWYDLPWEDRVAHMERHGEIGRSYAGEVTQMITGSIGFDDWEWGVTLWATDATRIKHLLYEMRFDPSTSRFAEFGPFFVGRRLAPDALDDFLTADPLADGDAEDDAAGAGDGHPGTGDTVGEDVRGELADLDVYAGQPHGEDVWAVVLYSDEDPAAVYGELEGLRSNFEHYDTHVKSAVYAGDDRTAVVSLWETASAAETAAGFLTDLPGAMERADEGEGFGTMGLFYTVVPEHRDDFVETFDEVRGLLEDMAGHRSTTLLANEEDPNDMFIASEWDSRDDAMSFFRSDAFRDTVEWGREVLADRPRHVFLA